ncbi:MAG: hypothetical protein MJK04_22580, partial [Psychrosphaera sp.]|nr:hypothetical protein [Psychrosphaera sp.]
MFFKNLKKTNHLATAFVTALFFFSGLSQAQGPIDDVSFSDSNLQACITEQAQANSWVNTEQVTSLLCHQRNIVTLDGIEQLTNLKSLNLILNHIEDISPLAGLTKLTGLGLFDNQIKDVAALSNLSALHGLTLAYNDISDISPLAGLNQLTLLTLDFNEVSDLSALSRLTRLSKLTLHHNQIADLQPLYPLTGLGELNLLNNAPLHCDEVKGLQQALTSTEIIHNCTNAPLISAITFADANLQTCINEHVQTNNWIYTKEVTSLLCHQRNIVTLDGIEQLTNLKSLNLILNDIEDISPLAGLTKLTGLGLFDNKIKDVTAL